MKIIIKVVRKVARVRIDLDVLLFIIVGTVSLNIIIRGNIMDTLDVVLIALLGVSEVLALIPGVKSNSLFTWIVNILKKVTGKSKIKTLLMLLCIIAIGYLFSEVVQSAAGIMLAAFTLVGYSETITTEDTTEKIAAIPDVHVKTEGDNIIIPSLNKILGYFAIGGNMALPQLESPSLRRLALIDISPFEVSDLPASPPHPVIRPESIIELVEDESLRAYCQNSDAADAVERVFVWLTDDVIAPVRGSVHTVRATFNITATAEEWSDGALTLDQSLPAGSYHLVGARCQDAVGVAFRMVFIGGIWRPGGICAGSSSVFDSPNFRAGGLGVWGTFRHDQLPSIEVLRNAAGSTGVIYLDIIKVS